MLFGCEEEIQRLPLSQVVLIPVWLYFILVFSYYSYSRIFEKDEVVKKTAADMQKTVLMDSETTLRKVLSGLIQRDDTTNF